MNNEEKKKHYYVSFTYTIAVEAEEYEDAEDNAHDEFAKMLRDGLHAGDFAMSDPEEVEEDWD